MRNVLRLLAGLVMALSALVAVPASVACACSCAELTTKQALQRSDVVFEGDVIARTPATTSSSMDPIAYTIRVSRVYKGSVSAQALVTSEASEASCGVQLEGRVLVFARGPSYALTTTLCSTPLPLDRSKLGEGRTPSPATASPPATSSPAPSPGVDRPWGGRRPPGWR